MWTDAVLFILLMAIALVCLGYFYLGKHYLATNQSRYVITKSNILLDLPVGFSISYSFYCLCYFFNIFIGFDTIKVMVIFLLVVSVVGLICWVKYAQLKVINNECLGKNNDNTLNKSFFYIVLLMICLCIFLPQFLLGNTPFLVSDSWSHISVINRMIDVNSTILTGFSLPNDGYVLRYSPHHAFLATIATFINVTALEMYKVARYFYPVMLVLAFLRLLNVFDFQYLRSTTGIILAIIVISFLFPTTDGVWRGGADYRIPAFIMMFIVLNLLYPVFFKLVPLTIVRVASVAILSIAIAVTHAVEISFLTVIIVPAGFYIAVLHQSKKIALYTGAVLFIFIVSGLLGLIQSHTAYAPLNKSMSYSDFYLYCINQLRVHVNLYTYAMSVFFALFLGVIARVSEPGFVRFLMVGFISSIILGPLNPLLYPLYRDLMGSSHSNRILYYAFPFYLAFFVGVYHLIDNLKIDGKSTKVVSTYVVLLLLAVASFGINMYDKLGLDGEFSYKRSDRLTQLNLYPHFYHELGIRYQHKVIISDVFTSAPVNAVTNNYIFTHRPWTGGQDDRFQIAKKIMFNPANEYAIAKICQYHIDVLAINNSTLPDEYVEVFISTPWLMSDFKLGIRNEGLRSAYGISYIGVWDDISIYEFQRDVLCVG